MLMQSDSAQNSAMADRELLAVPKVDQHTLHSSKISGRFEMQSQSEKFKKCISNIEKKQRKSFFQKFSFRKKRYFRSDTVNEVY